MSSPFERTLLVAERVQALLHARERDTCVIGGVAVAIHGYLRATKDLDLAIVTGHLREHAAALAAAGLVVEYAAPGEDDPVGGVVRIEVEGGDPIEIVNFGADRPGVRQRIGLDTVRTATPLIEGSTLRVVDFPHLVATKLLAGGPVDEVDLFMLLRGRSPEELVAVEALCQKFRLTNSLAKVLSRVRG